MELKTKVSEIPAKAVLSDKDGYTWTVADEGEIIEKWEADSARTEAYAELVEASPAGLCSILERNKEWELYRWMVEQGGFGIYAVLHADHSKGIKDQSLIERNGAFYSALAFDLSLPATVPGCYGKDIAGHFPNLQDDPEGEVIQELENGTGEYYGGYAAAYVIENCAEVIACPLDEEYTFEDAEGYWRCNGAAFC